MKDVEHSFRNKCWTKTAVKEQNSFIPPYPFYEFQMDLPFINGWKNKPLERVGKNIYFTKCVVIAPIQRNGKGILPREWLIHWNRVENRNYIQMTRRIYRKWASHTTEEKDNLIVQRRQQEYTEVYFIKG